MRNFISLDEYRDLVRAGKAPKDAAVRKSLIPEATEPLADTRQVRFTVSSSAVDRDNDMVNQAGWDLAAFKRNPVVLWAHDYSSLPVGKAVDITVRDGRLVSTVEFATHPFAETVYQMVKGGFLNATSVGFRPTKVMENEQRRGMDFHEQELLEYSIVPVPANPEALIEAASAAGVDVAPIVKWAESLVIAKSNSAAARAAAGKRVGVLHGGNVGALAGTFRAASPLLDVLDDDADPVRWNRQLSKAFDVDGEPVEPSAKLYGWVSRYLNVPVKDLYETSMMIGGAKMGAKLVGLDEQVGQYKTETVRNLHGGTEAPPVYETIQLNSRKSQDFLVEGTRFLAPKDGIGAAKWVLRMQPSWGGIVATAFCAASAKDEILSIFVRAHRRAHELNFLKGEAFTLSGEFMTREASSFDDVYLDAKLREPIERTMKLVNEQGAAMESRGLIFMGPPGTGKTLVARTIMHQCPDATFVWASSRDFGRTGMFYGVELAYELAKENAPTVVFMDDIDSWWSESAVDLLKTTLDGLQQNKGIVTILATNFPETLPEALIDRPGRFHDVLLFALPDETIRRTMLAKWAPDASASTLAEIAKGTEGYSGAHIRDLVRYADTIRAQDQITIDEALTRSLAKVKEQRDLIDNSRGSGTRRRYRAVKQGFGSATNAIFTTNKTGVRVHTLKDGQGTCDRCDKKGGLRAGVCDQCFEDLNAWSHEAALAATAALTRSLTVTLSVDGSLLADRLAEMHDDITRAAVQVEAEIAKRGRVLSSANEGRLRRCQDLLTEVLAQLEVTPIEGTDGTDAPSDPNADPAKAPTPMEPPPARCEHDADPETCPQCSRKAAAEPALFTLDPDDAIDLDAIVDDEEVDLTADAVKAEMKAAFAELVAPAVGTLIADATRAAFNRARGRLD